LGTNPETIGAELSPQLGFKNPKNESLTGHNSKTVGARTLTFGAQKDTEGKYLKWDKETNRIKTDETGRGFPFLKVPMGHEPANNYYLFSNYSQVVVSFNYLLPSNKYLPTN